jgi:hypothetical protein
MGLKSKKFVLTLIVVIAAISSVAIWHFATNSGKAQIVTNAAHQTTQISYDGKDGANALDLLKKHATVATKHYSFGDVVTSINGTDGSGPKYWIFYINGQAASEGAGTYITKKGDLITWKLQ